MRKEVRHLLNDNDDVEMADMKMEDPWRVFRIMGEFVEGFHKLSKIGPAVSIFGSARTSKDNKYYKDAEETAGLLVKKGYAVITGGGPGTMEAGNKGADNAGGLSVGLSIYLPHETSENEFVNYPLDFHYFFCRKVMFLKYAKAFIIFPGGFGTLDELFESLTLIQTKRMEEFPIILYGTSFWKGLLQWLESSVLKEKNIDASDLNLYQLVDSPQEAIDIIDKFYQNKPKQTKKK